MICHYSLNWKWSIGFDACWWFIVRDLNSVKSRKTVLQYIKSITIWRWRKTGVKISKIFYPNNYNYYLSRIWCYDIPQETARKIIWRSQNHHLTNNLVFLRVLRIANLRILNVLRVRLLITFESFEGFKMWLPRLHLSRVLCFVSWILPMLFFTICDEHN